MNSKYLRLLRNFAVEMLIYGVLLVAYLLFVLQSIGDWLASLYERNLPAYAILSLALIVIQGVALEIVTTFLVKRAGLRRTR